MDWCRTAAIGPEYGRARSRRSQPEKLHDTVTSGARFTNTLSREPQSLSDVLSLEIGVSSQYFRSGHAVRDHAHRNSHGNAQASDAGYPPIWSGLTVIRTNTAVGVPPAM